MIDEETLDRVVEFHGHMCPGLAMGIQAAQIALREIGPHAKDEEVVAVVETDMCGVDAIQFLTGCTFGKGNLIHRDFGKNAYSFFRRSDGRAVRISVRPDAWQRDPEHQALFAKVRARSATDEERRRFQELHASQSQKVLALDPDASTRSRISRLRRPARPVSTPASCAPRVGSPPWKPGFDASTVRSCVSRASTLRCRPSNRSPCPWGARGRWRPEAESIAVAHGWQTRPTRS